MAQLFYTRENVKKHKQDGNLSVFLNCITYQEEREVQKLVLLVESWVLKEPRRQVLFLKGLGICLRIYAVAMSLVGRLAVPGILSILHYLKILMQHYPINVYS